MYIAVVPHKAVSEVSKFKGQITPHVKPSECYETQVMTWDGGSRW